MKRAFVIVLALSLALALFGCGKQSATQSGAVAPGTDDTAPAEPANWEYDVETLRDEQRFTADDGTVVATKTTELPRLVLKNAGGAADAEPPTEMRKICDAFNGGVFELNMWDIDIEEIADQAREQYESRKREGIEFFASVDELTIENVYRRGDLLSVLARGYVDLGGAHPDWYLCSWNFDLGTGRFVDSVGLGEDPAAMHEMIANHIVEDICASEERACYNDSFESLIPELNYYEAYFDENGMTVYFQEYQIAPRALGLPQFTIPYAELSRFLSADGARLLALTAEEKAN